MCLFGVVGYRCIHSNFIVVAVTLDRQVRRSFYIMETPRRGIPSVVDQSNLFLFFFPSFHRRNFRLSLFRARNFSDGYKNNICLTRENSTKGEGD